MEIAINPQSSKIIRDIVRKSSGIVLDQSKDYLLKARLAGILSENNFADAEALVAGLKSDPRGDLVQKVVDALTTNETLFFRDKLPFDALTKTVIPALVEKRASQKKMAIWSSACSTGQEPYSIAIVIKENFPQLLDWDISILATDISTEAIRQAREGVYNSVEAKRGLSDEYRSRYLVERGDRFHITEAIKRMVEFKAINLTASWPYLPIFDVIFVRNVLIYFDDKTKKSIFEKVHKALAPDGFLFVAAGEQSLAADCTMYQPAGDHCSGVFQKVA